MSESSNQPSRLSLPIMGGVLLLALVLRVVWGVLVPVDPVSDSQAYNVLATSIANGQGYAWANGDKTAYWAPGAAMMHGGLWAIFGKHFALSVIANVVVGILTVWLVMLCTYRLAAGKLKHEFASRWAILAGLVLAVWPSQIQFTTVLNSELPFNAAVMGAVFGWLRWMDGKHWAWLLLVGVCLGVATYMRPIALLIPVGLALHAMFRQAGIGRSVLAAGIVAVVMMAVVLPWSLRNERVMGSFVLMSTNGAANLWMGNHPGSSGGYHPLPKDVDGLSEIERSKVLKQRAMDHIRDEPMTFAKRIVIRTIRTHDRESIGAVWNEPGLEGRFGSISVTLSKWGATFYWWGVLVLAGVGCVISAKKVGLLWTLGSLPILAWFYFASVHAVIVYQDRYHFPSIPFIAMLAGLGLWGVMRCSGVGKDKHKVKAEKSDAQESDKETA